MKKIFIYSCFLTFIFITIGYSITPYSTVDWTEANTDISSIEATIYDISDVNELKSALSTIDRTKRTMLKLEARDFIFSDGDFLDLDSNVIISGEGPSETRLFFNVGDGESGYGCIRVTGEMTVPEIMIDSNYPECINFDSDYLVLVNASSILPGDYIKFYVDHDNVWRRGTSEPQTYSDIGQVLKVTAKNGNRIYLDDRLHLDFRNKPTPNANWESLNPRIRKIKPAHHVGIENLYIGTVNSSSRNGSNIVFTYASNCRVSNVESYSPTFYHVSLGNSINVKVEGSYFHHGNSDNDYSGGHAYGVFLTATTTSCLVEDNIFYWLRHAICFAGGANGNVAGYNSSNVHVFQDDDREILPSTDIPCSDYFFHGHYPFANLVEGNVGHYIHFDHWWGNNGPYNMIFKNATIKSDESYGIWIQADNPYQNVIGNYFVYSANWLALGGYPQGYRVESEYIYQYHNYDNGEVWYLGFYDWEWIRVTDKDTWYPNQGSDNDIAFSYYRTGPSNIWPQTGDFSYTARTDLKANQFAYNRMKASNYNPEYYRYVTLNNVNEATGGIFDQGYFALRRKNFNYWYDNIPSRGKVRVFNNENEVDVRALQEKVESKKHHKWDDNRQIFLAESKNHEIGTDNEIVAKYYGENQMSFNWTEPVKVYLKDPWYVSNQQTLTQPQTFREISSGTNIPVFLNEGGSNLSNLDYPYYSVRAQRCYATQNAIYAFDHWSSPNSKAVFDPNNIYNSEGCGVRFTEVNAIVKPVYTVVNNITNYTLTVPSGETLSLPAGANITFAEGFKIVVEGALNATGT
ncbi:MAG: hypothetical protein JXB49_30125, partial [Bacteroidales bacterium]|nr:hypothetical protein [Bacteroidales bacterium]